MAMLPRLTLCVIVTAAFRPTAAPHLRRATGIAAITTLGPLTFLATLTLACDIAAIHPWSRVAASFKAHLTGTADPRRAAPIINLKRCA